VLRVAAAAGKPCWFAPLVEPDRTALSPDASRKFLLFLFFPPRSLQPPAVEYNIIIFLLLADG